MHCSSLPLSAILCKLVHEQEQVDISSLRKSKNCGNLPQCNRRYRSSAQILEPWRPLDSATAGGKRIKTRPLSAVVTQSLLRYNETTARLRVQRSPTSKRPDYLPRERRPSTSLADRCKSPQCWIHICHRAPATQHREAQPATCLLPAEPSLLLSEQPRKFVVHNTAPLRATIHRSSQPARTA
jgi:hypothetical protein